MIINGLELPDGIKYVKFHELRGRAEVSIDLKNSSADIYGDTSKSITNLRHIADLPIHTDLEYTKLPSEGVYNLCGVRITKRIYESIILNIFIARLAEDEVYQDLSSVIYVDYDNLLVILREDEATPSNLAQLLNTSLSVSAEVIDDKAEVGNVIDLVMYNDTTEDIASDNTPISWNESIAQLDWSQAIDGLLSHVYAQLKEYDFNDPLTTLPQEIPDKTNLIQYKLGPIQYNDRGHLVGKKWKYLSNNKMRVDFTLQITDTATYYRVLYAILGNLIMTNVVNYQVLDNYGHPWDVACTWTELPPENEHNIEDLQGSGSTGGYQLNISCDVLFFTISKPKIAVLVTDIMNHFSTHDSEKHTLIEINNIN